MILRRELYCKQVIGLGFHFKFMIIIIIFFFFLMTKYERCLNFCSFGAWTHGAEMSQGKLTHQYLLNK